MRLFNTLTRREDEFSPADGRTVRMYACGPTVYNRAHIGNFRTFVCVDVLRRAFKYHMGWEVRQAVNFTDVDDRTIAGSQKEGVTLREHTDKWIAAFLEDTAALGIEPVEERPRATDPENLKAMTEIIESLDRGGHTYRSDGSIYYKISTFSKYGDLARLDHAGIQPGARVDTDNYDKEDARDFVLWKATKPGEPTWDLGLGPGRPGWHIECSAMALRLLGAPPIDLHAGGIDLVFPHHENEIAQSEGATGAAFSRFWFHVEFLLIDRDKMSKSLGNQFTVPDIVRQGHRVSALRYLLLSTHYRKQLMFTWDSLKQAEEALRRITDFLARLDTVTAPGSHPAVLERVAQAKKAFGEMIEADLNTAGGLGVMFELVRSLNTSIDAGEVSADDVPVIRDTFAYFDRVLGVISLWQAEEARGEVSPEEIEQAIADRQAARRRRDFAEADRIRQSLADRGVLLEDSAAGTRWKRK
jgi:cysteinyl-tRNA synthetase